ncbi:endonuclease/exonuclease/phosphatase family protein [Echinicola strongylocentroti]|uniref:Endonuclease/exonuclease/phosphatase family protein n=1 Tax=Echinicola strongylocentroti TaxID=1795355 RepID=A0A2Z4IG25_9BACT|nr:endonuclease/exonuclease/phosphatase family protein [Echinicola strongylocentroti]AWW29845.1 endonuclease/exonuclease/phosphatase family protein [Echinicola strongylocentroti]
MDLDTVIRNASFSLLLLFIASGTSMAQEGFKVLSYNTLRGFQQDSLYKASYQRWVEDLGPDVIGYQEMNDFTQKGLESFASGYGHPYAVMSKIQGYPVALSSKYPILNVQKVVDNMWHAYLYAQIKDYHVFVVHFSPFLYQKRQYEIRQILAHAALLPQDEKIVIMGGFNSLSSADSAYHTQEMVDGMRQDEDKNENIRNLNQGQLDYPVVGIVQEAGYLDAFLLTNDKLVSSYPTKSHGGTSTERIDYIWVNPFLGDKLVSATIIQDEITDEISDHYPVFVQFEK